jgi:hypothetical protein
VIHGRRSVVLPLPEQSALNAGAGGIYSTADDLAQWMLHQLEPAHPQGVPALVTAETRAYLQRPAYAFPPGDDGPELNRLGYALGWYNELYRGYPMLRHGGYTPGLNTMMALVPGRRIGVMVMTNHDHPALAYGLTLAIIERAIGGGSRDWLAENLARQNAAKTQPKLGSSSAQQRPASTAPRSLRDYSGHYSHPAYGTVTVSASRNGLNITWAGHATPVAHKAHDLFETTTSDQASVWAPGGARAAIKFMSNFAGQVDSLEIGGLTGVGGVVFRRTPN